VKQGFHLVLGVKARWHLLRIQVRVKLIRALVTSFVENHHLWVGVFTSTLDGLVTGLKEDSVELAFQFGNILD
jgi:hypothetical protein